MCIYMCVCVRVESSVLHRARSLFMRISSIEQYILSGSVFSVYHIYANNSSRLKANVFFASDADFFSLFYHF